MTNKPSGNIFSANNGTTTKTNTTVTRKTLFMTRKRRPTGKKCLIFYEAYEQYEDDYAQELQYEDQCEDDSQYENDY